MNKVWSYWGAQIGGWGALTSIVLLLQEQTIEGDVLVAAATFFFSGILITHFYRLLILKLNWLRFSVGVLTPLVIVASGVMGALLFLSLYGVESAGLQSKENRWVEEKQILDELQRDLVSTSENTTSLHEQVVEQSRLVRATREEYTAALNDFQPLTLGSVLANTINRAIIFFFWSVLYFGYHYFEKSREQEIRNIKLVSSKNEIELQNLRTQLNPHFMFNSMNSIRALIDEDPGNAKMAVTKLSNLLRSTLIAGRRDLVSLQDELEIVKDYLDLEKIRFEERLDFELDVEPALKSKKFPPLLLQTLTENAVKHGISKLAKGGEVKVIGRIHEGDMMITVLNSGKYEPGKGSTSTGIGLENSRRRLDILFGPEAQMAISNHDGMVRTQVVLPIID